MGESYGVMVVASRQEVVVVVVVTGVSPWTQIPAAVVQDFVNMQRDASQLSVGKVTQTDLDLAVAELVLAAPQRPRCEVVNPEYYAWGRCWFDCCLCLRKQGSPDLGLVHVAVLGAEASESARSTPRCWEALFAAKGMQPFLISGSGSVGAS